MSPTCCIREDLERLTTPSLLRPLSSEPAGHEPHSRRADGTGSADEGPLLQERLRLMGLVATGIAAAFYGVGLALSASGLDPLNPIGHASFLTLMAVASGTHSRPGASCTS
jgi:hypothetical protein